MFKKDVRIFSHNVLGIIIKKVMLKMDILISDIDYRVASLSKRYLTTNGIIPESLKSIQQF